MHEDKENGKSEALWIVPKSITWLLSIVLPNVVLSEPRCDRQKKSPQNVSV